MAENTAPIVNERMQDRIARLIGPHVHAINDGLIAAFPDVARSDPVQLYATALAFQLGALLGALASTGHLRAVDTINAALAKTSDYRLTRKLDS
jgi:hypothetical protein